MPSARPPRPSQVRRTATGGVRRTPRWSWFKPWGPDLCLPHSPQEPVTCRTVPGIQLREYRTEVNGAKAGLHGKVRGSPPQWSPPTAGRGAASSTQAHVAERYGRAEDPIDLKANVFPSLSGRIRLSGLVNSLFVAPEQFEIDPNYSIKTTFLPGKLTD